MSFRLALRFAKGVRFCYATVGHAVSGSLLGLGVRGCYSSVGDCSSLYFVYEGSVLTTLGGHSWGGRVSATLGLLDGRMVGWWWLLACENLRKKGRRDADLAFSLACVLFTLYALEHARMRVCMLVSACWTLFCTFTCSFLVKQVT